jgi:putative sugar O-methyltransferase
MHNGSTDSGLEARIIDQIERMQRLLADAGYGDLGMWDALCKKHITLLREQGFQRFKRTINFEYNQWSVRSFVDMKSLSLAATALRRLYVPSTALRASIDIEDAKDTTWTKGEVTKTRLLAYRLYLGMLWDFARSEDDLGVLGKVVEPDVGRPMPVRLNGTLISQDLALSSLELNAIARQCSLPTIRRVGEIGAGYGRLAWLFLATQPQLSYHIFDIPPALAVSQNYLLECFGNERITSCSELEPPGGALPRVTADSPGRAYFHLPLKMDDVESHSFDLMINVSSFDEMPKDKVDYYFDFIDRKLKGLLYLKGYRYNPASGWSYTKFPYRPSWRRAWSRTDPTNPMFIEQIFRVNS